MLTDGQATERYDHVIFDTAPTGHTLRLLQLPTAWSNFLDSNESGASCLGPLSGLEKQRQQYALAVAELANAAATTMVLVARPQHAALAEADRTSGELAALGITNQRLVINGIMPESTVDDPLAHALRGRESRAMDSMPQGLLALPQERVALQPRNLVGVAALRALVDSVDETPASGAAEEPVAFPSLAPLATLIDQIEQEGHGLVMVLGKGGVGKTTVAAAIALDLAGRGHDVHLTTTDPAAHLAMTVGADLPASLAPRLVVDRIDPEVERARYRDHVLATKGAGLDEQARAVLEEDLRSPCTEEIAVFQALARAMQEARRKFVVVDTAPTGHTLLLIDATGAYHRDVVRHMSPDVRVVTPMMRLQDPSQTKMVIVTLPETTPVLEAEALQADLRRAGIEPWAWVINSSLAAAGPLDPLLVARARQELPHIERVLGSVERAAILPWVAEEPVGSERLLELARSATQATSVLS